MHETHLVHGVDGKDQLCHVETRQVLGEYSARRAHQQAHEIASRNVLHDKVQVLLVLERIEELDHPLVVRLGHEIALSLDVSHLVLLDDELLAKRLHGVQSLVVHFPHKRDFAKRTDTQCVDFLKLRPARGYNQEKTRIRLTFVGNLSETFVPSSLVFIVSCLLFAAHHSSKRF